MPASAADPAAKTLCLFAPNSARGPGAHDLPEAITGPRVTSRPNPAEEIGVYAKSLEIPFGRLPHDVGQSVSSEISSATSSRSPSTELACLAVQRVTRRRTRRAAATPELREKCDYGT